MLEPLDGRLIVSRCYCVSPAVTISNLITFWCSTTWYLIMAGLYFAFRLCWLMITFDNYSSSLKQRRSAPSSYTMATNLSPLRVPIASSPSQTAAPAVDLTGPASLFTPPPWPPKSKSSSLPSLSPRSSASPKIGNKAVAEACPAWL
jgi:hypothetical protein